MMNITTSSPQQVKKLHDFVIKHSIRQLTLSQTECRLFFTGIEKAQNADLALIDLISGSSIAENVSEEKIVDRITVSRELLIGDVDFFSGSAPLIAQGDELNNPFTYHILDRLIVRIGIAAVISKIAEVTAGLYPISIGQTKAVLTKMLGYALNSGTRSFIHDLRMKIRRYKRFVLDFEDYVALEEDKAHSTSVLIEELNHKLHSNEKLLEEVILEIKEPSGVKEGLTEFHDKLKNRKRLKDDELPRQNFVLPVTNFVQRCQECNYTEKIETSDLFSEKTIEIKQHHGKDMLIQIVEDSN